jgi:hypothetical protein
MRPYKDAQNGKTPKKRAHTRRGEKAMNGVKKTLTKAKVTAVKTTRKLQAKDAEEVEDLLEQTANGQPGTPVAKAVTQKVTKAASANKQMKKLKSLVEISAGKGERKSERLRQKTANGISDGASVEKAQEAIEINGQANKANGGLLQRTISKIWRIPEGITGAVPYADMEQKSPKKAASANTANGQVQQEATNGSSCVIS